MAWTTSALPRLFYLGGIDLPMPQARAIQTLHTAHAMAQLGCRVYLAVGRAPRAGLRAVLADYGLEPHPELRFVALPSLRLSALPLRDYVHPRLALWNWSYGLAALAALWLLPSDERPDLVLARDPRLAWLFLQARRLTGAAVVYEVHELFSTRARESSEGGQARPPTRSRRLRRLEEAIFREAAGLVTLTGGCRGILVDEFGVPPERVLVAPDAVASIPPRLPPRAAGSRTVVYAGQLYPWKGLGTLVRAMALLPDARLRIVGGMQASDPHGAVLRQLAREQGTGERIEFTGFVPHARVAAAIGGAAAAAIPLPDNPMARYFTSPLKLFEYMAAGLPVVASDLPALREILRPEQNALLVPPDDSAALAAALGRLLDEPELAERLRSRAFAELAGRTWRERAARMVDFMAHRLEVSRGRP